MLREVVDAHAGAAVVTDRDRQPIMSVGGAVEAVHGRDPPLPLTNRLRNGPFLGRLDRRITACAAIAGTERRSRIIDPGVRVAVLAPIT